ncbi:MAG TPA: methyltransferase domain-containing protein [Oculatellaceae cyanobacterium]
MTLTTFSKEYQRLNQELHQNGFGGAGDKRVPEILPYLEQYKVKTLLDYGAGQGKLKASLSGYDVTNYDPGVPEYSEKPQGSFDAVVCTDVLEHIEPEYLDNVLKEIFFYSTGLILLLVHFGPSGKTLSDGRNAHLIQKPPGWWEAKFNAFPWELVDFRYIYNKHSDEVKKGFYVFQKRPV